MRRSLLQLVCWVTALALVILGGDRPASAQILTGTAVTKTLSLGTASGKVGDTVTLPVKIDGDATTKVGGLAFTLLYDPDILQYVGIEQATTPTSDGSNCKDATTGAYDQCDAATIGSTLFYQANDEKGPDGNPLGKLLVAAATAQGLDNGTALNVLFKILGGDGIHPVRLVRTIIHNPAAGYDFPTLLEPLVGMPADQPDANGFYPTPPIMAILNDGTVTVSGDTYTIAGTVKYDTNDDGAGDDAAEGSTVILRKKTATSSLRIATTTVDSEGSYSFADQPAGDYLIVVQPADPNYIVTARDVSVQADATAENFTLQKPTRYSGTITYSNSGLAGVTVTVKDPNGTVVDVIATKSDGSWTTHLLPPLPEGQNYTFTAKYGNTDLTINTGDSTWSGTLYTISGNITGVESTATTAISAGSQTARILQTVQITGPGAYTIPFLPAATDWIIAAVTEGKTAIYYDGKTAFSEATPQTLPSSSSSGNLTGIDFAFETGISSQPTISGRVTKNGAAVPENTPVYAFDPSSYRALMVKTDADGNYSFSVLPGSYQIFLTIEDKTFYYSETGPTQRPSAASLVTVTADTSATGINFALTICTSSITGTITYDQAGLPGVLIEAIGDRGNRGKDISDDNGGYTIEGLCADTYTVSLTPIGNESPPAEGSVTIGADEGETQTLDFSLTADNTFTLTGTVTDASDGSAISAAILELVNTETKELVGGRIYFTDANGSFTIRNIDKGTEFTLTVRHPDYTPATESVISNDDTKDLSITMSKGGKIAGTVTDSDTSNPIAGATVVAVPLNTTSLRARLARSGQDGAYEITGLDTSATYLVTASMKGYERAFQSNVVPSSEGTTTAFQLQKIAKTFTLEGTVQKQCADEQSPSPLEDARVIASYQQGTQRFFATARTDATGSYSIPALPQADGYTLLVIPPGNLPIHQETLTGTTSDTETSFTKTADVITIACGASISGTVTVPDTVTGITKVYVVLLDATNGAYVNHVTLPASGGAYEFKNLVPTQQYQVLAAASGKTPVWYEQGSTGTTNNGSASMVQPVATNIDITLQ